MLFIFSTTFITLALIFYSLGVWSERLARYLKSWHVAAFWTGLLFDISGTWMMHQLAGGGPLDFSSLHTLTGQIALWLMLVHAMWATLVALKGSEKSRRGFHKYSLIVWIIWLIPYFGGLLIAVSK